MQKVAIITGGTGTIGAAIADRFQRDGQTVVIADVDERPVPDGQVFVRCDATDPADVTSLFQAAQALGTITTVVVAHGIGLETIPGSADPDVVSRIIDINLKGTALVCDSASGYLGDGASILLVSSMSAFMGRLGFAFAYQASKAGIESLTRVYAVTYGPNGIRVNCIAPGSMVQPMKGGKEVRERLGGNEKARQALPLRRLVTEGEIAEAAAFLCSDCAPTITGVVLPVDSGMRAI